MLNWVKKPLKNNRKHFLLGGVITVTRWSFLHMHANMHANWVKKNL